MIFDAETIQDMASFSEPFAISQGIKKVWVNGQLTYEEGIECQSVEGAGRFLAHEK